MKITHKVPNQPPRVSYTPGMRASMTQQAAAANTNNSSGSGSGSPATAGTAILQKKPAVGSGAAQPAAQVGSLSQRPWDCLRGNNTADRKNLNVFYLLGRQQRRRW